MRKLDLITRWFGVTVFELCVMGTALINFLLLVTLKLFGHLNHSWFTVFSPLFLADAISGYFCTIVFIRLYLYGKYKKAIFRTIWSFNQYGLLFIFKSMVCIKLEDKKITISEVLLPIFLQFVFLTMRICHMY